MTINQKYLGPSEYGTFKSQANPFSLSFKHNHINVWNFIDQSKVLERQHLQQIWKSSLFLSTPNIVWRWIQTSKSATNNRQRKRSSCMPVYLRHNCTSCIQRAFLYLEYSREWLVVKNPIGALQVTPMKCNCNSFPYVDYMIVPSIFCKLVLIHFVKFIRSFLEFGITKI